MAKTVAEEYAELFHYTNAEGLHGIITSQCLRATNISFLNDAEERIHYLDQRLPIVLEQAIRSSFKDLIKTPEILARIEKNGGLEKAIRNLFDSLIKPIREATLSFDEPYVVSFCGAKDLRVARHGLLSQWRAYGTDGGYAIVFDTARMETLLKKESEKYMYLSLRWGDVNYYDGAENSTNMLEEFHEKEAVLNNSITNFLKTSSQKELEPVYDVITSLSCLTKHWGFHEEKEVRIVAVRGTRPIVEEIRKSGDTRPERTVHHRSRDGTLVPYICLFDGFSEHPNSELPIKAVIVGPHPESKKRKQAVELLLEQRNIAAKVVVSEIPYLLR